MTQNSPERLLREPMLGARVCLVDKDPALRRELESNLAGIAGLRLTVFEHGTAALGHLAAQGSDVVLAGQSADEVTAGALLRRVQERQPDVVRVVISDAAHDPMDVLRRFPYAHQYLRRPLEPRGLAPRLRECVALRQILAQRGLRSLVSSSNALPAAPDLYSQLIERLSDPTCSMRKVAEVIERDAGMSARLMQLVSSGFFGLSSPMTSIGGCVAYLGLDPIRSLVLSAEIARMYPLRVAGVSTEKLQARGLGAARLARRLCDGTPDELPAFLSGLFHVVGQLVLASRAPMKFAEALRLQQERKVSLCESLSLVFGATDGEVAGFLLGLWGQPLGVVQAIVGQDAPERIDTQSSGLATMTYVSKRLSLNPDAPLSDAPTRELETLNEAYLSRVGSLEQLPRWREVARRLAA